MHLLPYMTFLPLLWIKRDGFVDGADAQRWVDIVHATLGAPLTLKCPYNCSGWTRASWHLRTPTCSSCIQQNKNMTRKGSLCTELLHLQFVSVNQTQYDYTCYSVETVPRVPVLTVAPQSSIWSDTQMEVICTTQGFYPRNVTIKWFSNGSSVAGYDKLTIRTNADGTFSAHSKVSLRPIASHHGSVFSCEVHHTTLSHPLRANITLEVKYLSLRVSYSSTMESTAEVLLPHHTIRTRVGAYLKLHCHVESNPQTIGQWVRANVTPSKQNVGAGATLTMGKVKVEDAGSYSCVASLGYETRDFTVTVEVENPGEFSWLKVLAATTVLVATVLAAVAVYFSLSNRRRSNAHLPVTAGESGTLADGMRAEKHPVAGESATIWEQVAVTFTPADCQSDHEVPYADILISVRGSSTPELTHIPHPTPREYRQQRWKDEGGPGALLQVSRSADRLHIHQMDVARKLSTSSEYAVIQYHSEPLG
ncbi:hypothetical protein JZ751_002296 [Albula glossodonta]|uniref:Ig-like domain-containing protein n=1 Tax=Albula glossodonta TaxID=121402 RepID=A0A8T2P9E6_9TELE|nr:hypothetical protein JZ751_002296 [Albula glossodonta]